MTEGVVEATPGVGAPPSSEVSAAPPQRGRGRFTSLLVPSIADAAFIVCAVVIPTVFSERLLNSDGDLPRHLQIGLDTLERGLSLRDNYSFTRPGARFVPFEWMSEVTFAQVFRMSGLAGVAIVSALVLALTYALVVRFLRRRGVDPLLSGLISAGAAVLGSVHWLARPHVFTFLGAILLLELLERPKRRPWVFLPFFVLWANFHGGFVYGLTVLSIYAAGSLLEAWVSPAERTHWLADARSLGWSLAFAVIGSCVTPVGAGFVMHSLRQVGPNFVFDNTVEFQSPDFHALAGKLFLVVLLPALALLAVRPRPRLPRLALILASVAFALMAQRNIPLFGLVALPLIALEIDAPWRSFRFAPLTYFRRAIAAGEERAAWGGWSLAAAVLLLAIGANQGRLAGATVVPDRFDAHVFPVEAVARARSEALGGRMLNDFVWGGYIVQAWPEQRVFIDGMTAFYGDEIMRQYEVMASMRQGWRQALDHWRITMVLFPTRSRLVRTLSAEPAWRTWYRDSLATILVRPAATAPPVGP